MKFQRGGFVMGMIVGLLIGLAVALGVALYVTKVPVPFVNKVPQRTPEQDAAEAEKNKNWDPNSPLDGKTPARPGAAGGPSTAASGVVAPAAPTSPTAPPPPATATAPAPTPAPPTPAPPPTAAASAPAPRAAASSATAKAPVSTRDPAAILADRPGATSDASTKAGPDPFIYFVQAGAYSRPEEAEAQRAKLGMQGFSARVTEREQAGRTVYRVRLGPFDRREDADAMKEKLEAAGAETALVRVQK